MWQAFVLASLGSLQSALPLLPATHKPTTVLSSLQKQGLPLRRPLIMSTLPHKCAHIRYEVILIQLDYTDILSTLESCSLSMCPFPPNTSSRLGRKRTLLHRFQDFYGNVACPFALFNHLTMYNSPPMPTTSAATAHDCI